MSAKRLVELLEKDILDRQGLGGELGACDEEVRQEIRDAWEAIIQAWLDVHPSPDAEKGE